MLLPGPSRSGFRPVSLLNKVTNELLLPAEDLEKSSQTLVSEYIQELWPTAKA